MNVRQDAADSLSYGRCIGNLLHIFLLMLISQSKNSSACDPRAKGSCGFYLRNRDTMNRPPPIATTSSSVAITKSGTLRAFTNPVRAW